MKRKFLLSSIILLLSLPMAFIFSSCESEDDNGNPADPGWSTTLQKISIESNSYRPKVTWVGGYVSVFGVNRGNAASLDESLVWLIKTDGNNLKYPVHFGILPAGATDITSQYGGTKADSLSEDEVYTFWVLKEDVWNQVSLQRNLDLVVDSSLSSSVIVSGDSVKINPYSYSNLTQPLDVFINIENVSSFGRLGVISVTETTSNIPVISWTINSSESSDPNISVIGISEGGQFMADGVKWEVYSVRDSVAAGDTTKIYGKDNVISSPVSPGASIPNTTVFVPFSATGLERNKTYYIWIANKNWDGEGRARFTAGYAYATFNVR